MVRSEVRGRRLVIGITFAVFVLAAAGVTALVLRLGAGLPVDLEWQGPERTPGPMLAEVSAARSNLGSGATGSLSLGHRYWEYPIRDWRSTTLWGLAGANCVAPVSVLSPVFAGSTEVGEARSASGPDGWHLVQVSPTYPESTAYAAAVRALRDLLGAGSEIRVFRGPSWSLVAGRCGARESGVFCVVRAGRTGDERFAAPPPEGVVLSAATCLEYVRAIALPDHSQNR